MKARVLLVEDEPTLVLTLTDRLTAEGYEVASAESGDEGFRLARDGTFDIVLLDVALPGKGGFDVLRDLRQQRVETPVLMLTARGQVLDRVLGLKLGADDYLPKPFDMMELLARIEAVLRRRRDTPAAASGAFSFGDIRVDFRRAEVTRGEAPVRALEPRVQAAPLLRRAPRRARLAARAAGARLGIPRRAPDADGGRARGLAPAELEQHPAKPEHIVTVHRMGYRFVG